MRLRFGTQWAEADPWVKWGWVTNTFPFPFVNSRHVLWQKINPSMKDAIFMVTKPKLGGNSIYTQSRGWHHVAGACAHSGDFAGDREFNSNVFRFLILIKACLVLFAHTFTWFFCPFAMVSDEWEGRVSIWAKIFWSSSHQLTICAITYNGL